MASQDLSLQSGPVTTAPYLAVRPGIIDRYVCETQLSQGLFFETTDPQAAMATAKPIRFTCGEVKLCTLEPSQVNQGGVIAEDLISICALQRDRKKVDLRELKHREKGCGAGVIRRCL